MTTWFLISFVGGHPLSDNKHIGPFYGAIVDMRVLATSLRYPPAGLVRALVVYAWSGTDWVDIDTVTD